MNTRNVIFAALALLLAVSACNLSATPPVTATLVPALPTATVIPATGTPIPSETPVPATETTTPTLEPTFTETASPTPVPTYTILRGKVNVDKVSCRYGPGAMYLYLYGMVKGANQDVIGRNDNGTWALTMSRGDVIKCWVKTDLMDLNGDIMGVAPVHPDDYNLPKSPFYGPLTNVTAKRSGSDVTISWAPLVLRAGDDSLQTPYVLQVWVCRSGELIIESIGSYDTILTVVDEPGCSQPSHGRITAAEKHGYTKFVEIPWP